MTLTSTIPWLTVLGLLPLLGALVAWVLQGKAGRIAGFVFAVLTLGLGIVVVIANHNASLHEEISWIPAIGAYYDLDMTGIGAAMVVLATLLVPIVLVIQRNLPSKQITDPVPSLSDEEALNQAEELALVDAKESLHEASVAATVTAITTKAPKTPPSQYDGDLFTPLALLLESLALFVFLAGDVLLFFLFFEATLVPMYFLIGGWGGVRRGAAALKFLLYSLAGGLVLLAGVVGLAAISGNSATPSLRIADLANLNLSLGTQQWLFIVFFIAFAVKAPLVPVHSWLPDVAEQASPATTVMLVGILDKIGAFGMIRFCLNLFPDAAKWANTAIMIIAIVSIFYGGLAAIASKNILRLVAYTSVSHFGFMVFGIFAFTSASISGSMLYMFAHGLSSAALFLVVAALVNRMGTAQIGEFAGVARKAPVLAGMFLLAGLATLSLPGFLNFSGEFMVLAGGWETHPILTVIAAVGTLVAAIYVLLVYQRMMTGEPSDELAAKITTDISYPARGAIGVLLAGLLVFGFMPSPLQHLVGPDATSAMSSLGVNDPAPVVEGGK
jgi:NADH-quinone oxidoreductase subunit M